MNTQAEPTTLGSPELAITTVRFGTPDQIMVSPACLYTFPDALPGLPDSHRFALIVEEELAPLCWLQSLDEVTVCLPLIPLTTIALQGYGDEVARAAGETGDEAIAERVLLVTRFDAATQAFVINQLAPVLLDPRTATGRQLILDGQRYPLRL